MSGSTLVFLQNAWSWHYAGGTWPRASWLEALERSRSGQRLRILAAGLEVAYHNTTPEVAAASSGVCPPDLEHVRAILGFRPDLAAARPAAVVACGNQARDTLRRLWDGPLLAVPHPAYRVLTDGLYERANALLLAGLEGRLQLIQKPGRVEERALA